MKYLNTLKYFKVILIKELIIHLKFLFYLQINIYKVRSIINLKYLKIMNK